MSERQAVDAYVDFHGDPPQRVNVYKLPDGDVWAHRLGRATAIAYETVRDGEHQDYIHEFGDGKGPYIDVATDGAVYLTEGRYSVTDRGFEDDFMPSLLTVNPHKRGTKGRKIRGFSMSRKTT
jgi:hypothetical protein